jgi:ribosome-associated protein
MLSEHRKEKLIQELTYTANRSSGPGGQNVNKVNTKVELRFNLYESQALSFHEIELLKEALITKLTILGDIIITVQASRSQLKNKEEAIVKFIALIEKALTPKKVRKATRPSINVPRTFPEIIKRLQNSHLVYFTYF